MYTLFSPTAPTTLRSSAPLSTGPNAPKSLPLALEQWVNAAANWQQSRSTADKSAPDPHLYLAQADHDYSHIPEPHRTQRAMEEWYQTALQWHHSQPRSGWGESSTQSTATPTAVTWSPNAAVTSPHLMEPPKQRTLDTSTPARQPTPEETTEAKIDTKIQGLTNQITQYEKGIVQARAVQTRLNTKIAAEQEKLTRDPKASADQLKLLQSQLARADTQIGAREKLIAQLQQQVDLHKQLLAAQASPAPAPSQTASALRPAEQKWLTHLQQQTQAIRAQHPTIPEYHPTANQHSGPIEHAEAELAHYRNQASLRHRPEWANPSKPSTSAPQPQASAQPPLAYRPNTAFKQCAVGALLAMAFCGFFGPGF